MESGSDAVGVDVLGGLHQLREARQRIARLRVAGACHLRQDGAVSLDDEGLFVGGWQCCCSAMTKSPTRIMVHAARVKAAPGSELHGPTPLATIGRARSAPTEE